jgi:hypothetical protein
LKLSESIARKHRLNSGREISGGVSTSM